MLKFKLGCYRAACNNPTLIQCSSVPCGTDARGTKQNKMQNFASPSLAIALLFMLGKFSGK